MQPGSWDRGQHVGESALSTDGLEVSLREAFSGALVVAAACKVGLDGEAAVEANVAPDLVELLLEPERALDVRDVADSGGEGEARPKQDAVDAEVVLRDSDAEESRVREERIEQHEDREGRCDCRVSCASRLWAHS